MSIIHETVDGELYTDNFSVKELRCRCQRCNLKVPHKMDIRALRLLQRLRMLLGRGFTPRSSYRCPIHPEERKKDRPGTHAKGLAMDIPVRGGVQRGQVVTLAISIGAKGIGVADTFVHVDFREGDLMLWKY